MLLNFHHFHVDFSALQPEVQAGLKQITGAVSQVAIPLAAIGATSMAFIQAAKNVTPLRSWFQGVKLRQWMRANLRGDHTFKSIPGWVRNIPSRLSSLWESGTLRLKGPEEEGGEIREIELDLIMLTTSGDADAFYSMQIEDMCDQIRKVVSVILDYPDLHLPLLVCLAGVESQDDIRKILPKREVSADRVRPKPHRKGSASVRPEPLVEALQVDTEAGSEKDSVREMTAAKSRLVLKVRCSIDAIQTSIGFRWKFYLQLTSMVLGAVLGAWAMEIGVHADKRPDLDRPSTVLVAVVTGVLAGFLAPVARDLVAALEKLRS
jgi:hypothetical protein